MANPFEKRATEYFREPEGFLAILSAEPLNIHFRKIAEEGRLFDRLVKIIGTPGSGKTTLAMLFQFNTLSTLLRNKDLDNRKPLISALGACGAVRDGRYPMVLGCRLPMEAQYREIWELPYADEIKSGLVSALIQARTTLSWLRSLENANVDIREVEIVARDNSDAALAQIGGHDIDMMLKRARTIERAIYQIGAALIPPDVDAISEAAASAYRPFDVIERIDVKQLPTPLSLQPLVILDDAHVLHPDQLACLERWLMRRDLRVARWIITRPDSLSAEEALVRDNPPSRFDNNLPGVNIEREITRIWLQQPGDLKNQRRQFRRVARDMADRYLAQMPEFARNDIRQFASFLAIDSRPIKSGQIAKLQANILKDQRSANIADERRAEIDELVAIYIKSTQNPADFGEDMRLAMVRIMLNRYIKRVPQRDLFEAGDPEPSRPLKVDASVAEGARIHLLHQNGRPYYFGVDKICDASSQNAETFLRLCGSLVSHAELRLMRRHSATLDSYLQQRILRETSRMIIKEWDFPHVRLVRRLADAIAGECLKVSLEPNAWLGGGANAVGILQTDYENLPATHPELATILHFGSAYNAFLIVPNRSVKNQMWCLIELGGLHILRTGLTLTRGGFLERTSDHLTGLLTA